MAIEVCIHLAVGCAQGRVEEEVWKREGVDDGDGVGAERGAQARHVSVERRHQRAVAHQPAWLRSILKDFKMLSYE